MFEKMFKSRNKVYTLVKDECIIYHGEIEDNVRLSPKVLGNFRTIESAMKAAQNDIQKSSTEIDWTEKSWAKENWNYFLYHDGNDFTGACAMQFAVFGSFTESDTQISADDKREYLIIPNEIK